MSGDKNEVQRDCVEVKLYGVDANWKYTPDCDYGDSREGWLTRSRIETVMQCIENSVPSQDSVILQLFDTNEDLGIEFVNDKGNYKCTRHVGYPPEEDSTTDYRESCLWMTEFVNANKQRVTPAPNSEFNLFGFMKIESKETVSVASDAKLVQSTTSIESIDSQSPSGGINSVELEYLQNLLENGESKRIRNYARWSLHALTNPDVLKSKRQKSVLGKSILATLIIGLSSFMVAEEPVLGVLIYLSCVYITFAGVLFLSWTVPRNRVTLEGEESAAVIVMQ